MIPRKRTLAAAQVAEETFAPGQEKTAWTHGCDNCDAEVPVKYFPVLGYLCEACWRSRGLFAHHMGEKP